MCVLMYITYVRNVYMYVYTKQFCIGFSPGVRVLGALRSVCNCWPIHELTANVTRMYIYTHYHNHIQSAYWHILGTY